MISACPHFRFGGATASLNMISACPHFRFGGATASLNMISACPHFRFGGATASLNMISACPHFRFGGATASLNMISACPHFRFGGAAARFRDGVELVWRIHRTLSFIGFIIEHQILMILTFHKSGPKWSKQMTRQLTLHVSIPFALAVMYQ